MSSLFSGKLHEKNRFSIKKFDEIESSYIATDKTIGELLEINGIEEFKFENYSYEFLVNSSMKTAVYLKCVSKMKVNIFLKKYKRMKNVHDISKRMTTTTVGSAMINYFFNDDKFKDYTLAVSCGNYSHECCCFFRKNENGLAAIYYNPSYSEKVRGVRKNANTTKLLQSLKSLNKIQSYYAFCGNVLGICSGMTWAEIYTLMVNGISPFTNKNINLENYNSCVTPYSYKKYWSKNNKAVEIEEKGSDRDKRFEMLKEYDDMLKHIKCPVKLLEINGAITNVILSYYAEKTRK